jgi:hypothetical protein
MKAEIAARAAGKSFLGSRWASVEPLPHIVLVTSRPASNGLFGGA